MLTGFGAVSNLFSRIVLQYFNPATQIQGYSK